MNDNNENIDKKMISEINRNPGLLLIFNKLSDFESSFPDFFFMHRDQIFLHDDNNRSLNLFWNNIYRFIDESDNENNENLTEYFLDNSILKMNSELQLIMSEKFIDSILGIYHDGSKEFKKELKDVVFFHLIEFIRQNKELELLIKDNDFSFDKMQKILKDYKCISFEIFKELKKIGEIDDISGKDFDNEKELIHAKIQNVFSQFMKYVGKDPMKFQNLTNNQFHQLYLAHFFSINHLNNMLTNAEIDIFSYQKIIMELYTLKLIENAHTLFWCENCRDEQQFFHTLSKIDPDHSDIECPKCESLLCCSTLFDMHPILLNSILFKDGLLFIYLCWLLNNKGIRYDINDYHDGRFEKDIIIYNGNKKILIECKMHRTDKEWENALNALIKDSIQSFKHIEEMDSVEKAYILCNYDWDKYQNILDSVYSNNKVKIKRKKFTFEIINYMEINKILQEIKS